ncbi:MAG: hypothetical protein ACR2OG_01145 [Gemmatimonadaceae bacterium]
MTIRRFVTAASMALMVAAAACRLQETPRPSTIDSTRGTAGSITTRTKRGADSSRRPSASSAGQRRQ